MLEPAQGIWGLEVAEAGANSLQQCPEHREHAQLQMLMAFYPKTLGKAGWRQFVAGRGGQRLRQEDAARQPGWVWGRAAQILAPTTVPCGL